MGGLKGLLGRKAGELPTNTIVERFGKVGHRGLKPRRRNDVGLLDRYLSSAGHVESRVNLRGPSRKAKYSLATDSEPVP